jgi:fructoselysine-6-P-deglycase FrlB-like protein
MKKVLSVLMVLLLVMALMAGCGDSAGSAENDQETSQNEQADNAAADIGEMGDLLSATYVDMMKNNEYLMKYKASMEMEGQTMDVEATVAASGDNYAMLSSGSGFETAMVIKDDKVYMIDHASKTVTSWTKTQEDETEAFDADGMTYVGSGEEDGLAYEEYTTTDGSVKYYFDGKKLVKIATTAEGQTVVMEILEMSNNVPADMFEIPADYQMMEM